MTFGGGSPQLKQNVGMGVDDIDAMKPDILRTLDLSRMEKKSIGGTEVGEEKNTVTDVE
jgi:hypothetical protein